MANYAVIKAAVEEVVKANGNEEITGTNLQSTLLSIIDSLGTGYQFMEVATPSTTPPSSPDYNIAYIGGAGTYANFGTSITIPAGSIGVFKYNGSWSNSAVEIFAGVDEVPTVGSDKLVTSNTINGELGELVSDIYSPVDLYTYTPHSGIILASGSWNSGNNHLIFPLDGIKKVVFEPTADFGITVAFLKTYDPTAARADFSADYPSRFTVPNGYPRMYDVPSDANFLYVVNKTTGINDMRPNEKIWLLTGEMGVEEILRDEMNVNVPRGIVVIKNKTVSLDAAMYPADVHITSSSTHDIVCMKIDEGVTKVIPVNANIGRFRFFNTYNKVDADSYISTTDVSSGAVPDGAQYVIMVAGHEDNPDGLDNLIIRTEPNTNDIVGAFEKMMGNETEQIDLSNLPDFGYIIQSDNKYHPTGGTAKGRVVALPLFSSYMEIEANENFSAVFAFLENTIVDADMVPNFADNNEWRYVIPAGSKARYRLNPSCKYLYFSKTSIGGVDMTPTVTVEYTMGGGEVARKQLGVLFIGSSGEQDMMGYVPPILKEVLYDYDITFGDMYYSGAQADNYVNFYKNDTPCSIFNLWSPDSVSWTRMNGMVIEEALEMQKWDLIVFKGSDAGCRQLMRIIQSLVSYPVCFATVANIPRVYDNLWEDIIEDTKQRCADVGFVGWIPVGTAMQNARSNDVLKMTGGISCPEPTEFTIPAGRFFAFQHRIRKSTASIQVATIKATRLSGSGEVKIYAGATIASNDYLLLTMNDAVEHTTTFDNNTNYIKIVNSGNNDVTVKFENTQANGDYLLFTDNQHTQSGIPTLISSYTIALKIMEWTGNAARGINAASFIPTYSEITSIGAADASGYGNGLGHGYSCGVDNYIGTDGNHYDRSQLTLFDSTLYVTKTVFDNTPDANSVSAVLDESDPIKYINVYAAQEVATLAVNYPDVESDCTGVVIEVPQKN